MNGELDLDNQIITGIHQERGDCSVKAADLSGHMRQVYLCEKTHSQVSVKELL